MDAAELIREVESERPLAVRLAEAVSLAVLIDPPLLRRARREMVPEADPGTEADLWSSPLVQTRSPDGFVLLPEVAQALRERLRDSGRLDEAWKLTSYVHGHFSPALKLEEETAWLSVSPSPDAAARIEELMHKALAALVAGERRGLASWAERALLRLPPEVRDSSAVRLLAAGARLRLGGNAQGLPEGLADDLSWITPADLPRVPVRVRLLEGAVELDASSTGATMLQLPQTDPLLIYLSWTEEGEEKSRQATFRQGGKVTVPVPVEDVRLRTILGEVYELRAAGRRLEEWFDFTAEWDRHRPFFGREKDQEEIQRWIRHGRTSGRMILVHGETGEGKTALLVHMIDHLAESGRLPPHHFFRRGSRTEEVNLAERSLRAQVADYFPEFGSVAAHLRLRDLLERISTREESGAESEPLIVVLDAVDEAQGETDDALLDLFPERLPPNLIVLASARSNNIDHLRLPEPLSYIPLSDATGALGKYWSHNLPAEKRLRLVPIHNDELILGSRRNFGFARVLRKWIEGAWWRPSEDLPPSRIDIERLWDEAVERLGKESAESWLGKLAAVRESLPSSMLVEILGLDLFNQTRNSPFETLLVTTDEAVHRLSEEVLREFIADHLNLAPHHQRIAEVATAALEEGSGASEQSRSYAVRHAVQHWIAAGDLEGARRLAVSAGYLIPKCRESGVKTVQQELRDCIEAVRSVEPSGDEDEKVDRTAILESTLEILSRGPLPPDLDSSTFLSHLFTGLLEQNWEPEIARAILQIPSKEPALRPKALVDRPLRRPGDRRHRGAVIGCRLLERPGTVPGILSWSTDGTLRLWEPGSGEMIHLFAGHAAEVTGAALLGPSQLVTSSRDGTLRLWGLGENQLLKTLYGHEGEVLGALGLTDRRAVSWSADRTIRVWDVHEGQEVQILRGHEDAVTTCAVTPNGWYLLSGSTDATVRQWDLYTGELAGTWRGHTGAVTAVFAGEGFFISTATDRTVRVWPLWASHSFEPMTLMTHGLGILGCTVLGPWVASWSYDQTIIVRRVNLGIYSDQASSDHQVTLRGHSAAVLSCAFFPGGDRLVSASADGTLRIWDVETGETLHVLEGHAGPVRAIALDTEYISSFQGRIAEQIVSASDDRTLRVWNAETGEEMAVFDGDNETLHCITLQDRRRIVTWSRMGDLKIYHMDSSEPPGWLGSPGMAVGGALITPDDRRLILWSPGRIQGQVQIAIWDLERGQEIASFRGPESPFLACAISPDGSRLIAGSTLDGGIAVWDLVEQQSITWIPVHARPITDIQMYLDGEWALSASSDGTLRALDLREMSSQRVVGSHNDRILACAIDLDGRLAVTASADRTLNIWDIEEGNGPVLNGHDDQVTGCAFTRDGTRVVSCSQDSTLGIWDASTGALLHRLQGHQDWVNAFVIDDDSGILYSCSEDRTVRAWDLASGEPRGVVYGVSPFRSLALTHDGVVAGDEAGNFWALELMRAQEDAIPEERFDVFLSHNAKDKPAVRELAAALSDRGLKVWLDEWELIPGEPWRAALETAMETCRSAAVLIGRSGVGPWEEAETRKLLSAFVERRRPVIPVLLPGASEIPQVPPFLSLFTWLDLRGGLTEEGLGRLVLSITGKRPQWPS